MERSRYVAALYRRWFVVVLVGLLGLGLAAALTSSHTAKYRASTSLFFSVSGASSVSDLSQGATYTQNLMPSFSALATTAQVLDPVTQQLGLHKTDSQLASMIKTKTATGAVILQIFVTDTSASQSAAIANAVAAQLAKSVSTLSPAVTQGGTKQLNATVVAQAPVPRDRVAASGKKTKYAEGLLGGLIIGVLLVLGREVLDTRVRNEEELHLVTGAPVVGRVTATRRPLLLGDSEGRSGEAFRALRANVFAIGGPGRQGVKSVVVAGSAPGDGATTTAINLALVAAETGLRVLLIEADMRRPTAARYLNLRESPGLIAVLANRGSLTGAVQTLTGYGVDVVPAGGAPANPGELVGSTEMAELIATATSDYDFVVIDAAAVLMSTDAAVLARYTDGAVIVVDTRSTKRRQLADATASLHRAGATLLGIVLNKSDLSAAVRSVRSLRRARPPAVQSGHPKVPLKSRSTPVASRTGAAGVSGSSGRPGEPRRGPGS
ncbi:MAG TPA: polysaccharide biosynthesis tyrosine autokinase [Acidothermaceae bacterium]|nr:polysaccharide biosynthesis tyrosine autokinase [Acidothermaceae bacterium]